MDKRFTVSREEGFIIHLDDADPTKPVYLGKAETPTGDFFAIFARQGDGHLNLLVRSQEDLSNLFDTTIAPIAMARAFEQVADENVKPNFRYDNSHVYGTIYWPNTSKAECRVEVGTRFSAGTFFDAKEEVTNNTPFVSFCRHTGSNATQGTIVRNRYIPAQAIAG